MIIKSDAKSMPIVSGLKDVERLVSEHSLGATSITLELGETAIRFDGIHSGNAMLYREDSDSTIKFVAMDTFDQSRIVALVDLFGKDPSSTIQSVEWLEDSETGWFGYGTLAFAVFILIVAFYGVYVEFVQ